CDRKEKEDIQLELAFSARVHNPTWSVSLNTICVAGDNSYQPDVGIWFQVPQYAQRHHPITNRLNLAGIYNQDLDRSNALERIANVQQTHHAVEFIGIALPNSNNHFRQNSFPGAVTVPATQ
ncbi:16083_t:CDS:2, partial [Funneliformis caledonium]